MFKNYSFSILIIGFFLFIGCSRTEDTPTTNSMKGCLYQSNSSQDFNLGNTFNNTANDIQFQEEITRQNNFWNFGYFVPVYVWYNDPGNAMARPETKSIIYGYNLFYSIINSGNGDYAIDGVLAHEMGHQLQFKYGWINTEYTEECELEADAFSGWYIGMQKNWSQNEMDGYFRQAFSGGSPTQFNDPTSHGTQKQRLAAARMGVEFGLATKNNIHIWDQQSLHTAFKMNIDNEIIPNP